MIPERVKNWVLLTLGLLLIVAGGAVAYRSMTL